MEFRVWVETRLGVRILGDADQRSELMLGDRILERELVARVQRTAAGIGPEEVGLSLEEGKTVLRQVQAHMIQRQVEALAAGHRRCLQYRGNQRVKDRRTRSVRTVFGTVRVSCRRYLRCTCRGGEKDHGMATGWYTAAGYHAGASVPICELGQQSSLSTSGSSAR